MRELFVVAVSDDGALVLATSRDARRGGFRLAADDRLRAALRGEPIRPGEPTTRSSTLTPKEIQARLRSGDSVESVAEAAGVPVALVTRFSGPVVSERARMVDQVRAARLTRARSGVSAVPIGSAADQHLAAAGAAESAQWSARRREDGTWAVQVSWSNRGRRRTAEWVWNPVGRTVEALGTAAVTLGHVEGVVEGSDAPKAKPSAGQPEGRAVRLERASAARARPRPAAVAEARRSEPTQRSRPAQAPSAAAAKPARRAPSRSRTAAAAKPSVPTPPPAEPPEPPEARAAVKAGRAAVPGWADILLGSVLPETAPTDPAGAPVAKRTAGKPTASRAAAATRPVKAAAKKPPGRTPA